MDRSASEIARCLDLAREGQPEAKATLFDAYRSYLRILASASLGRDLRGKADPSDVVQETLLKAHEGFEQFRGTTEQEWTAWLRKILDHKLVDLRRGLLRQRRSVAREQSLQGLVERSSGVLRDLALAAGPTPSQQAESRELGVIVAEALEKLEPLDREVVILRSFEGMNWDEIGERIGRSSEAARKLWGRALQRVGAQLLDRSP
jgi:RNA polymerase sigma-70 factor, ECF subfamily